MKSRHPFVAQILCVVPAFVAAVASAQVTQYQTHLNAATLNAGSDPFFTTVLRRQWCYTAENAGAPPELGDRNPIPLTRLFDDLYVSGLRTVTTYIRKTNSGLFVLDALNNATEAQNIIVPSLQALGLSPSYPLLGVMPTHGHGDHFGGAAYLQQNFGTPVYLGSADAAGRPFVVTPLDSANLQPQPLRITPDFSITALSTPGHTPGTFSGVIPVHQNGVQYKLAFWGGTGMPGTIAPARQYLDGTERLYALARDQQADGTLHTHPFVDGSLNHVDEIRSTGNVTNPFILGTAQTLRSLAMLRECAAAKVAQIDATAVIPVWRVTTTQFVNGSPTRTAMAARVESPWGPVQGQQVTFRVNDGAPACVATTDAGGVATCAQPPQVNPLDKVTASFGGRTTADYMELASSASAAVVQASCDVDRNGQVDRLDIAAITAAIGRVVGSGDVRDADGDGRITIGDARMCTLRCAKAACAP